MSNAHVETSSEATANPGASKPNNTPGNALVTIDLTASKDAQSTSTSPQEKAAVVSSVGEQPRSSSAPIPAAAVPTQTPLQGLEEAARQISEPPVPQSVNAPHGHHLQQPQPVPPQNARPFVPAPVRGHPQTYQQEQPPAQPFQQYPPMYAQPQPTVFYPQTLGTPLLMNQCPRCGLRAGEPFQSVYYPQNAYYAPPLERPRPVPKPAVFRQEQHVPPPPNHPNAHMWVPPPGYQGPLPAPPTSPAHPLYLDPDTTSVLPRHSTSSRLPTPPPARQPLTLVDEAHPPSEETRPTRINGRRRKSKKPYRRRMSRDERRDILLMRKLGYKMEQIARYIGATVSAVNYTIRQGDPEPKHKNAGRKVVIPEDRILAMVAYAEDYLAKEKACAIDKRTGRNPIKHLSYNMIRQAVFADENGEIPAKFKYTDDALKSTLNKRGVWLRQPMSQARIEIARARGKRLWQEKVERERLAAEAVKAGNTGDESELTGEGYVDAGDVEGGNDDDEDEDMEDASSDGDSISIPNDNDEDSANDDKDR